MPGILALDLSLTRTGVCRVIGGRFVTSSLAPPKEVAAGIERLMWYAEALRSIAETERPTIVAIEDYAMGGKGQRFRPWAKGELGGIARVEFARVNAQLVLIPPKVVKKFSTGNGNAEKRDVRAYMMDKLGASPCKNDDEGDAAALAYFAKSWSTPMGLAPWRYELLGSCHVYRPPALLKIRARTRGQSG